MSATIENVAKALGVSVRGVRLRVDALGAVIDGHLAQGANNRTIFDGEAFAILRRMEDVRKCDSVSIRQAASCIREELDGNSVPVLRQTASSGETNLGTLAVKIEMLERLLDEVQRDRDHWRNLAENLQLALPAPRRGFFTLFRRRAKAA